MSKHIVCPTCLAINRIPDNRLKDNPSCGKCHDDLFSMKAIEVDTITFNKMTTKSSIPVIVDF